MKKILLALLFLSFLQTAGICQHWERLNYYSYSLDEYNPTIISTDGKLFYASVGGIYKSEDNGGHWKYSSNGMNAPISIMARDIYSDESGIYCLTLKGVYKSTDNGASWNESNEGITVGTYKNFEKIFKLNDKLFVYQRGEDDNDKLYVSTDNAQHWILAKDSLGFENIFVVDSSIYGVKWNSIKKSDDGYLFTDYISPTSISSNIRVINGTDENLFAITWGQLFHSASGGAWETLSILPEDQSPVSVNYLNDIFILSASGRDERDFYLYYSSDKGKSWKPFIKDGLEGEEIVGVYYLNGQYIALTDVGLYLLKEGSSSWEKSINGLNITSVWKVTVSGNVLLIEDSNGISRSTDKGETWTKSLDRKPMGEAYYIDELINSGKYLFAKTSKTLYKSDNHGETWSKVIIPINNTLYGYNFNVAKGDSLILTFDGINGYGQYLSVDGGVNWNYVSNNNYKFQYLFLNDNVLFATNYVENASGEKLIRSDNLGQTWEPAWEGLDTVDSYISSIIRGENNTLYLSHVTYGDDDDEIYSLYKSVDNGLSWDKLEVTHTSDLYLIIDLKYYDGAIYVSYVGGMAKSTDGGQSWEELKGDLPGEVWGFLEFMEDDIYCGSYTHGIWKGTAAPLAIHNKSNSNNDLLIYPNPASDYAYLKTSNSNSIVTVFNMQGELIKVINVKGGDESSIIELESFCSGIYVIKHEAEGQSYSKRLVVVK